MGDYKGIARAHTRVRARALPQGLGPCEHPKGYAGIARPMGVRAFSGYPGCRVEVPLHVGCVTWIEELPDASTSAQTLETACTPGPQSPPGPLEKAARPGTPSSP